MILQWAAALALGAGAQTSTAAARAQTQAPPAPRQAAVTLSAVGDIRLDGAVGRLIERHGASFPSSQVRPLLQADIVFGNLECSVTTRGSKTPKKWNFRAKPQNLAALKKAGFTILNVANNHTWDFGEAGFLDTISALKKNHLPFIGGGKNRSQAESLRVVKVRGLRVGFLGFTSTFPEEAWAKTHKPGVAYSDFARLPSLIREAKTQCDVLIVSFHGGTELSRDPTGIQKAFAHDAVKAGADLVLGHHPHVLEPVEIYQGKPILYSLGNFLFVSPSTSTAVTAIAKVTLGKGGVQSLDFAPIDVDGGVPRPASPAQSREVYADLNASGSFDAHPEILRFPKPRSP